MAFGRKPSFARYLAGASVMAMGLGATAAAAQDATANEEAAEEVVEGNVIVVSGIRKSLQDAMNIKRDSQGVVDAISAEDIGKFPDTNLAESLQRITGVSIDRENGEGARVTVRGFGPEFNLVTLNGRQMPTSTLGDGASAPSSRSFDFGNLASEAVAAVEVYKTGRATVASGGIGSVINIRTPRPLSDPGTKGSFMVKGVYDETQNGEVDITPEVSGIFSHTMNDDTIGIALTGSYQKRKSGFNQFFGEWRDGVLGCDPADPTVGLSPSAGIRYQDFYWGALPCTADSWQGPASQQENNPGPNSAYEVPQFGEYSIANIDRERINGQAVLQFRPADNVTATLDYTLSQNDVEVRANQVGVWFTFGNRASSWTDGPTPSPIFISEAFSGGGSDLGHKTQQAANRTINKSLGFNLEWEAPGNLTWVFDAHTSSAESKPMSPYGSSNSVQSAVFGVAEQRIGYDTYLPVISFTAQDGVNPLNPAERFATGSVFHNAYFRSDIDQVQVSGNWEADLGFLKSVDFGVSYLENKIKSAYGNITNDAWGGYPGSGPEALPDDLFYEISIIDAFAGMEGVNDPNIIKAFYGSSVDQLVPVYEELYQICSNPRIGTPMGGDNCLAEYTTDRRIKETTLAPFVEANFGFDLGTREANLITGLRYETTTVDSSALVPIPVSTAWVSQNEFTIRTDPLSDFTRLKGDYDFWLPNVDFDMEVMNDVVVRASYSHTIARPSYADLQGGRTFSTLFRQDGGTGNQGNPGLLPYKSENFDVSAEWYYGPASYLSVGYFRKNVKNFIGSGGITTTLDGIYNPFFGPRANAARNALGPDALPGEIRDYIFLNFPDTVITVDANNDGIPDRNSEGYIDGQILGVPGDQLVEFDVTLPVNSDQTATLDGWEFALQHNFWETGFGVILNYTIVNGDAKFDNALPYDVPQFALPGLSDSANAVLFYDKGGFQARAAWNWRDEFLAGYSQNPTNPFYREAYWQIDASASYEFDMGLTVFAEAINLTGEDLSGHKRSDDTTFFAFNGGPRYAAGVRFSF